MVGKKILSEYSVEILLANTGVKASRLDLGVASAQKSLPQQCRSVDTSSRPPFCILDSQYIKARSYHIAVA
jgi:hypothetical protein